MRLFGRRYVRAYRTDRRKRLSCYYCVSRRSDKRCSVVDNGAVKHVLRYYDFVIVCSLFCSRARKASRDVFDGAGKNGVVYVRVCLRMRFS